VSTSEKFQKISQNYSIRASSTSGKNILQIARSVKWPEVSAVTLSIRID
jgi:hypothetical protein